jgi:leucyl aminopeptidase
MLETNFIDTKTNLPQLSSQKELTQRVENLLVVLTEENLAQPPAFLKALGAGSQAVTELKKKKKIVLYGNQDDLFGVCYVRLANLSSTHDILDGAGDQTRVILGDKVASLSIYFADSVTQEQATSFLTGVCLSNYKFVQKSYIGVDESAQFKRIASIAVVHSSFNLQDERVQFALQCTRYSLFCRQILSVRALEANPETMLELCRSIAQSNSKISIEAIVGKELQEKGLNLIYSVGRGAAKKPCLVTLSYKGNPNRADDVLALVGKGVCFDSGGLNLKPTGFIEEMWSDKGGACTTLAIFKAAVELNLPINLVCTMAFVENLVGSDAYHPSDIIKSYKGLTVEIGNTDAEGRLILCDAMTWVQEKHKPNTLIEFSTLTGAVRVALGLSTAGIFSNSDDLVAKLLTAAGSTNERLWRLPIFEEHRNNMKGVNADLNNLGGKGMGGASTAAAYLENFVEKDVNWAHIDIAGTATSPEKFVYSDGATGFGVRLILEYIRTRSTQ